MKELMELKGKKGLDARRVIEGYVFYIFDLNNIDHVNNMPEEILNKDYTPNGYFRLEERMNFFHYLMFVSSCVLDKEEQSFSEFDYHRFITSSEKYVQQVEYWDKVISSELARQGMLSELREDSIENDDFKNNLIDFLRIKSLGVMVDKRTFFFNFSNHVKLERLLEKNIPVVLLLHYLQRFSKEATKRRVNLKVGKENVLYIPELNIAIIFSVTKKEVMGTVNHIEIITIINNGKEELYVKEFDDLYILASNLNMGNKRMLILSVKKDFINLRSYFIKRYFPNEKAYLLSDKVGIYSNKKLNIYYKREETEEVNLIKEKNITEQSNE